MEGNDQKLILPNGGYKMHTFEEVEASFFTYIHDANSIKYCIPSNNSNNSHCNKNFTQF